MFCRSKYPLNVKCIISYTWMNILCMLSKGGKKISQFEESIESINIYIPVWRKTYMPNNTDRYTDFQISVIPAMHLKNKKQNYTSFSENFGQMLDLIIEWIILLFSWNMLNCCIPQLLIIYKLSCVYHFRVGCWFYQRSMWSKKKMKNTPRAVASMPNRYFFNEKNSI